MSWQYRYGPAVLETAIIVEAIAYALPGPIEWKLAPLLACVALFLAFRIDGRFFALAALLHLWLVPFLLAAAQAQAAETAAIYAFFFLAAALVVMARERWRSPYLLLEEALVPIARSRAVNALAAAIAIAILALYATPWHAAVALAWYLETVALALLALRAAHHHDARAEKGRGERGY